MQAIELLAGSFGETRDVAGETCIATRKGQSGAVMYGPYEMRPAGRYRVQFSVAVSDIDEALGDPVAATLDVCTGDGQVRVAERFILLSKLTSELAPFTLEFETQEDRTLEYRVVATGKVPLLVSQQVRVSEIAANRKMACFKTGEERSWENEREFLDGYLRNVSGLIHVGANLGQERRYYWIIGLDVIWVEPIREIYEALTDRLASYPRQRAFNALLTSRAGEEIGFQIANNNGASSSILSLEDHAVIFPDVDYVERRTIVSTTLSDLAKSESIPLDRYQALTLDVEGAERMVLEGAVDLLPAFDYVKCEVADFPARTGTPTVADLDHILKVAGFEELARRPFANGPANEGTFWDVVWKKTVPGQPLHEPGYSLPLVFDADEVLDIEKCE